MTKHILLSLTFFFISVTAFAKPTFNFGFEPYAGWQFLGQMANGNSNPDKFNGMVAGSRMTVLMDNMFFCGADISTFPICQQTCRFQ